MADIFLPGEFGCSVTVDSETAKDLRKVILSMAKVIDTKQAIIDKVRQL